MGLSEGLAGLGLAPIHAALMAAVSGREPDWDECLMMS